MFDSEDIRKVNHRSKRGEILLMWWFRLWGKRIRIGGQTDRWQHWTTCLLDFPDLPYEWINLL